MFKTDVTQTYTHFDASAEILIMLTGAFLLGGLLIWLLNKKTQLKQDNNDLIHHYKRDNLNANLQPKKEPTKKRKLADSTKNKDSDKKTSAKSSSKKIISDFTIINGITPKIEKELRKNNIHSYSDLRDINKNTLAEILSTSVGKEPTKQAIKTWPHQAALAAKGDWRKLAEYQDFIEQLMLSKEANLKVKNGNQKDDLQKIKGIGPRIEQILNNKGIYTYRQLKKSDAEDLKEYISNADSRFKNNQTSTWSHQANMAEKNQWKELAIYQDFMDDINIDSENLAATIKKSNNTNTR